MIHEDNISVEVCESKAVSVAAVIPMRIIVQGPPRQRPLSFPLQGYIYHVLEIKRPSDTLVEQIEH
jgi:hypothetical protein